MKAQKTRIVYSVLLLLISTSISAQIVGVTRGGQNNNPNNLNDQDKYVSENYIHEGYLEREKREACGQGEEQEDEDLKKVCAGMDVGNQSVKMIAKALWNDRRNAPK